MYCEKCNVDFAEGLHYCKWCGEALTDRPRVTSELHTCPSCATAIQPSWAYCKACGEPLQAARRDSIGVACPRCGAPTSPGTQTCLRCGEDLTDGAAGKSPQDSEATASIATCPSCSERLDTGSLYCKACGSAVYIQQEVPFGGSAMLCSACNSYSPVGSRVCRVCQSPFAQAYSPQTVVDRPIPQPPLKSDTLPDLDEHLPKAPGSDVESGANTIVFGGPGSEDQSARKRTLDTSVLPGTAGSRSEQQTPTQVMQMGRVTGPVEERETEPQTSGDLPLPATGEFGAEAAGRRNFEAQPTVEMSAWPGQPAPEKPITAGFGAESADDSISAESKTEVFTSRAQPTPIPPAVPAEDDVRTREFVAPKQPSEIQPTRQMPAIGNVSADEMQATREMSAWQTEAGPGAMSPTATRELAQQPEAIPSAPLETQPPPEKRTGMVIASAVVAVIIIGAAAFFAWWFLTGRARPAPKPPPVAEQTAPAPPPPPEKPAAPTVPEGMVSVAAATYVVGQDKRDPLEQPEHKVDVAAFFIDKTEVTNAAYKKFVDATGHKPPSNWTGANYPEGRGDAPVTGVTWQDAADYAASVGKRLPTEAEWEAAARGTEARIYPWGNDWRADAANIGAKPDKATANQYPAGLKPVGSYPQGASLSGVVDMIGNAWEWVSDEFSLYPGNTESTPELDPSITYRVIRGGAYDGNKVHDATYRGYLDGSQPYPKVGFRCAKNAK
ncbi:MAG TPA: SUMF1/EgtB/PvdO family nonheme iron enzyme [Blastocatellia bacterium]|nr:SUMF1/EgtB/PvdO family nonheme iron enzyme [Blastocatellia bacterium]